MIFLLSSLEYIKPFLTFFFLSELNPMLLFWIFINKAQVLVETKILWERPAREWHEIMRKQHANIVMYFFVVLMHFVALSQERKPRPAWRVLHQHRCLRLAPCESICDPGLWWGARAPSRTHPESLGRWTSSKRKRPAIQVLLEVYMLVLLWFVVFLTCWFGEDILT